MKFSFFLFVFAQRTVSRQYVLKVLRRLKKMKKGGADLRQMIYFSVGVFLLLVSPASANELCNLHLETANSHSTVASKSIRDEEFCKAEIFIDLMAKSAKSVTETCTDRDMVGLALVMIEIRDENIASIGKRCLLQ